MSKSSNPYDVLMAFIKEYSEKVDKRGPTSDTLFNTFAPGVDATSEFWLINLESILTELVDEGSLMCYRVVDVSEDWRWVSVTPSLTL